MTDPFTQTYQAIRAALLAWVPLAAIVKPGNIPDLSAGTFERFKPEVQPGDLPELLLMQGKFQLVPHGRNSMAISANQTFPIVLTFDSLKLPPVNQLKFEVLRAVGSAAPDLGLPFIGYFDITECVDDAFGRPEWTRKTERWVSLLQVNTVMNFPRNQLLSLK
jgi:hypothetical protein